MPNFIDLDFTGVEPFRGGMFVHIPAGRYKFTITAMERGNSRAGNAMVTAVLKLDGNNQSGVIMRDQFPMPTSGGTETKVGLARMMGMMYAVGYKPKANAKLGKVKNFDMDKLLGKSGYCNVADRVMKASEEYPEDRTVSNISTYDFGQDGAVGEAPKPQTAAVATVPAAAAQESVASKQAAAPTPTAEEAEGGLDEPGADPGEEPAADADDIFA